MLQRETTSMNLNSKRNGLLEQKPTRPTETMGDWQLSAVPFPVCGSFFDLISSFLLTGFERRSVEAKGDKDRRRRNSANFGHGRW